MKTDDPNTEDYENTKHVISLIKNEANPDNKKVYFNHNEIHANSYSWSDKTDVTFHHGVGNAFVGGHFDFNHDNKSALGSFQQGEIKKPAMLLLQPPEFNVALSKDAGAKAEKEGI